MTRGIYAELRKIVDEKKACIMLSSLSLLLHAVALGGGGGSEAAMVAVGGIAGPSRRTRGSVLDLTARQAPNFVHEADVADPGMADEAVSGHEVQAKGKEQGP